MGALHLRRVLQKSGLIVSAYRKWVSVRQELKLKGHEDAVFHGPQFFLPVFGGRRVVTIHDLSVYSWAHCHPPGRVKMMQVEIARAVQCADMVLTDSEFTGREVAAFFSLPLDRLRAVPLGSSDGFFPRGEPKLAPVLTRLGLKADRYCLYAGTIEPRKNIDTLLDAYERLPYETRKRWPLVLCGYQGWQSERLHARIEKYGSQGWVRYLGYVSGDDLPYVFAGARLFAFPSLYEGFGLPVLEAMASGVPVVCSDSSSLPEVAGEAAAMCAPQDTDALTALLARGLEDDSWRAHARKQGLLRAAQFSWRSCAEMTGAAYRAVLRQSVA
ncbi:MAG: glycosyltransferase family 1 protein [Desulfobacterales bacterium]|nr:glycosyltransferase family 1 protein [Desulfobacterales bacterium]